MRMRVCLDLVIMLRSTCTEHSLHNLTLTRISLHAHLSTFRWWWQKHCNGPLCCRAACSAGENLTIVKFYLVVGIGTTRNHPQIFQEVLHAVVAVQALRLRVKKRRERSHNCCHNIRIVSGKKFPTSPGIVETRGKNPRVQPVHRICANNADVVPRKPASNPLRHPPGLKNT